MTHNVKPAALTTCARRFQKSTKLRARCEIVSRQQYLRRFLKPTTVWTNSCRTGGPEIISSPVGLVTLNALVLAEAINSQIVVSKV